MSLQNIKKTDVLPKNYSMTGSHRLWRQRVLSEGGKESPHDAGSTVMGDVGSNPSFAGGGRHISSVFSGRTKRRTGIKRNVSIAEGKRASGRESKRVEAKVLSGVHGWGPAQMGT